MKLVRFGAVGEELPGILDHTGRLRDLSGLVADIDDSTLSAEGLARLTALDPEVLPLVDGEVRYGSPVARTRQFIAIGLNYSDHAAETGQPVPSEPIIFTKGVSCIQGPNDDVRKPRLATKMDWEVELGIVIGTRTRYVEKDEALDHVAGYLVCDDLSERAFQMERGQTWDRGKGCETFGPVGPWLVTKDEIGDVQNLDMWLDVNGKRMQTGNPRIIDGDTLETLDKKRVRLSGIDAPDEDGKGNVPKIAAQLYLEELVKQNGGMDCTSDFQDEKLTVEPICNTRRTSWGRSNLSCRFRSNGASVSATMVRHGYAVDYRQHSGLAYARFMKDAADERRGLWGVDYEAMRNLAIERGQLPNKCK